MAASGHHKKCLTKKNDKIILKTLWTHWLYRMKEFRGVLFAKRKVDQAAAGISETGVDMIAVTKGFSEFPESPPCPPSQFGVTLST